MIFLNFQQFSWTPKLQGQDAEVSNCCLFCSRSDYFCFLPLPDQKHRKKTCCNLRPGFTTGLGGLPPNPAHLPVPQKTCGQPYLTMFREIASFLTVCHHLSICASLFIPFGICVHVGHCAISRWTCLSCFHHNSSNFIVFSYFIMLHHFSEYSSQFLFIVVLLHLVFRT